MAKVVKEPPINLKMVDENGNLSLVWKEWFSSTQLRVSGGRQVITAAANINQQIRFVDMTVTSGTYAVTLDVPTEPGMILVMESVTVSGGGTITMALTNCVGGSAANTCTWNSSGDTLVLISRSGKWVILKEVGTVMT